MSISVCLLLVFFHLGLFSIVRAKISSRKECYYAELTLFENASCTAIQYVVAA